MSLTSMCKKSIYIQAVSQKNEHSAHIQAGIKTQQGHKFQPWDDNLRQDMYNHTAI